MIAALKTLNLTLRFGLELALLGAIAIYYWRTIPNGSLRTAATIGVPVVVITIWATVVHGANVPTPVQLAVQVALFGAGVAAIAALRRPELATTFGITVFLNATLMWAWSQ